MQNIEGNAEYKNVEQMDGPNTRDAILDSTFYILRSTS